MVYVCSVGTCSRCGKTNIWVTPVINQHDKEETLCYECFWKWVAQNDMEKNV